MSLHVTFLSWKPLAEMDGHRHPHVLAAHIGEHTYCDLTWEGSAWFDGDSFVDRAEYSDLVALPIEALPPLPRETMS